MKRDDELRAGLRRMLKSARERQREASEDETEAAAAGSKAAVVSALLKMLGKRHVLLLTDGELQQLRHAAGNSCADDDWYHQLRSPERRALLSVAEKVGFPVMLPGKDY